MPVAESLLSWFDASRRDLPWRETSDPYSIWISEIMAQQTRVETVIPFYRRFLARYPDVASLAAADEGELLSLWSGLGYYRRCRMLHAAARQIVAGTTAASPQPELPRSARELAELPGIGPYTAAAIASIAFGEPVPVLDGNVERVISRYAALPAGMKTAAGRREILALAASFLDLSRPGDSNQALMELGATVCTPRAPRCPLCPLANGCAALAQKAVENFPARSGRAAPLRIRQLLAVVFREGKILLFRRPSDARQLAGLWEFPLVDFPAAGEAEALESEAVETEALELVAKYGGRWALAEEAVHFRHAITTRSFEIEARRATLLVDDETLAENESGFEAGWWSGEAALALPLTGLARKVLARREFQPSRLSEPAQGFQPG
ncbi:MAG: A/G-specific adenine glycosylase [Thermoanaerobaculia bacterium]